MFNRGHWKKFEITEEGPKVAIQKNGNPVYDLSDANETSFATDWLVDRSLEILERDKGKPFCLMLALPDPHGPNTVRAPYDTMYDHLTFQQPVTMRKGVGGSAASPRMVSVSNGQKTEPGDFIQVLLEWSVASMTMWEKSFAFWSITNWWKIILVFTSDHGDMMCEHCRMNKGLPIRPRWVYLLFYAIRPRSQRGK